MPFLQFHTKPAGPFEQKLGFGESPYVRLYMQILPEYEIRRMNPIAKIVLQCLHSESTYTFTLRKRK